MRRPEALGRYEYMFSFTKIAEERIRKAIENGELNNLPGQGRPLIFEDDRGVPEELRLAYKILRNADCLPPELLAQKDIRAAEDLLAGLADEREKLKAMKRINYLILKLNEMRRRPVSLEEDQRYYPRLLERVG